MNTHTSPPRSLILQTTLSWPGLQPAALIPKVNTAEIFQSYHQPLSSL